MLAVFTVLVLLSWAWVVDGRMMVSGMGWDDSDLCERITDEPESLILAQSERWRHA